MIIAVERTRPGTVIVTGRLPDLGLDVRTSTGLGARPYCPTKKPYICPRSFSSLTQKKLVNQEASIYVPESDRQDNDPGMPRYPYHA